MSNKIKRNITFMMVILTVILYVSIFIKKLFLAADIDWWMWVAPVVCFIIFLGLYRNFSQAVKEDEKYGPIK